MGISRNEQKPGIEFEEVLMIVERVLNDIPDSDVAQVISNIESEGYSAIKIQQADGNWTIIATCPVNQHPTSR